MGTDTSKLSPRAKKAMIVGRGGSSVSATVELAPGASPESLDTRIESLGGVVRSWSAASHVMTLSLPCARLADLAADRAVVYIEADGELSLPETRGDEDAANALAHGAAEALETPIAGTGAVGGDEANAVSAGGGGRRGGGDDAPAHAVDDGTRRAITETDDGEASAGTTDEAGRRDR